VVENASFQLEIEEYFYCGRCELNPLPPSDAVSTTGKIILDDLFRSVLSQFKKYHPSGNLKFHNLGTFQSLKLRILMEKILRISLKLNFTPNTLTLGYGLRPEDVNEGN